MNDLQLTICDFMVLVKVLRFKWIDHSPLIELSLNGIENELKKIVAKSKLYRLLQQFQLGITFQLSGAMQTRAYE